MITLKKNAISVGGPVIFAGVVLATALAASEKMPDDLLKLVPGSAETAVAATTTATEAKGDLRVDLADTRSRRVRCVSRQTSTMCTGWPVSSEVIASAK
ncbi:MAG: hypothetical protein HWE23_11690 [Rhodobacteraceae bacterium]|nr:hypothetical protein [Paracoccaceae bacterium]